MHFFPWDILGVGIIKTFWTISILTVLNCFKYFLIYILGQNVSKDQIRKTISSDRCSNTVKLYTLKALHSKNIIKIKILSRSILKIHTLLQENTTLPEYSIRVHFHLRIKQYKVFKTFYL